MKNKSPYSDKELSYFRKNLKKGKKSLDKEVDSLAKLIKDQERYVAQTDLDFGSDASQIRNVEMLKNMRRRTISRQKDYRDALRKIKNGIYGICEKTGKKISKQRLMAMPEARTCIRMKSK